MKPSLGMRVRGGRMQNDSLEAISLMDGQSWNAWNVLAAAMWITAGVLIVCDAFFYDEHGMGPLTPFAGIIALGAVNLTAAGVVRAAKDEVLNQMHTVFEMGRSSVQRIDQRR